MSNILKCILLFFVFILFSQNINSESIPQVELKSLPNIFLQDNAWADSVHKTLTIEEKITQLFMIPVYSNRSVSYEKNIIETVKKHQVGGLIFMQGGPIRQINLTNKLQSVSKIPLMISMDAEWGLSMRLDSTISYPKAMVLGALQDDKLIYDFGVQMAEQLKQLGVHISFSPVVDINVNPKNPVINIRSFGEDKFSVARKGWAYAIGLQDNNILAVAKHFPGHGDTSKDSHFDLPMVNHSKDRLDSVEIMPFKDMIINGVGGVMVAHLAVPSLEQNINRPASLSKNIIDSLLLNKMQFKGLVFTDALNMKGVTKHFASGQVEVEALLAGNDVLLFPEDIDKGIEAVVSAVKNGIISEELINQKSLKVLKFKNWLGLSKGVSKLTKESLYLFKPEYVQLKSKIVEQGITLIENKNDVLPLKKLDKKKVLAIDLGSKRATSFKSTLRKYMSIDTLIISGIADYNAHKEDFKKYTDIFICHTGITNSPRRNFGISSDELQVLKLLSSEKSVHLCFMGNPYGLSDMKMLDGFKSILIAYNDDALSQEKAAQAVFGGIPITGKLPISINKKYKVGCGVQITKAIRLSFSDANEFGLSNSAFYKIDSIALDAIRTGATPGCQILYAKNNKVIYNKSFGFYTYDKKVPVNNNSIYDLASVTKVAATTIALMKLYDEKKIDINAKVSKYIPILKSSDKSNIKLDRVLAHCAGFEPWIPFYKNTLTDDGELNTKYYSTDSTESFGLRIANDLFLRNDYPDSIYQAIVDTVLRSEKEYCYSDLGFYLLPKIVESQSNQTLDKFVYDNFYSSLGMNSTFFNPLLHTKKENIVPSEYDNIFRKQKVQGYVNDPGAAMLGGVSGHAGLFSNANDLAKLGQVLLNGGSYGGENYFGSKTLEVFNKLYFKKENNRRALGFDKPVLNQCDPSPTCISASQTSFGHMGFTGIYFWVDPEVQSVYIFLSNRTFPDSENKKLAQNSYRTNIQQEFYNALDL